LTKSLKNITKYKHRVINRLGVYSSCRGTRSQCINRIEDRQEALTMAKKADIREHSILVIF
jgi:hypothetical protein